MAGPPTPRRDSSDQPFPDWSGSGSLRPELRVRAGAAPEVVLGALEAGLRSARFRVSGKHPTGFRARYTLWWRLLFDEFERTTLLVEVAPGHRGGHPDSRTAASSTEVLVAVLDGAEHPAATDRAARGLGSAIQRLRDQHVTVTATPWTPPADR